MEVNLSSFIRRTLVATISAVLAMVLVQRQHQNLLVLQLTAGEIFTLSVQDERVGAILGIDDL